jgi:hypothetical protein
VRKFILALAVIIMVTATVALASGDAWGIENVEFKGASATSITYNLVKGEVTFVASEFTPLSYRIDVGTKTGRWVAYDKSKFDKAIANMPKKGGKLWISNAAVDRATKAPTVAATTVIAEFNEVLAPDRLRIAPNYFLASQTSYTVSDSVTINGGWVVFDRGDMRDNWEDTGKILTGLEYAYEAGVTKFNDFTSGATWTSINPAVGLPVSNEPGKREGTVGRATYFVRSAATLADGKYTAPSQFVRMAIAPPGKAPNVRGNFKTETIRFRAGQVVTINATVSSVTPYTRDTAKADLTVNISDVISHPTGQIRVQVGATAKRPSSAVGHVEIARRAAAPNDPAAPATATSITVGTNGRPALVANTLEARIQVTGTTAPNKWGKAPAASAITATTIIEVRVKSNAKLSKDGTEMSFGETRAASLIVEFSPVFDGTTLIGFRRVG